MSSSSSGPLNPKEQNANEVTEKTKAAIAAETAPQTNNKDNDEKKPTPLKTLGRLFKSGSSRGNCRMFFPSSGRMGFDQIKISDEFPPVETLREMIQYETRLRLSESIQDLMDTYCADEESVTLIHDLLQQHVVEQFGYHDVNALRTALYRFPDDPVVKDVFYVKYNQVTQGLVSCGENARDVDLFTIDGQPTTLFAQISSSQPTLLLAASSDRINALIRSFGPKGLCILTIYIAEAHAKDQWPVGKTISCVDQPTTIEQRLENARRCKENFCFETPMLVDNMNNTFHQTYGAWPFRFYVIYQGQLVFKAEPDRDKFCYDLNEIDTCLKKFYP